MGKPRASKAQKGYIIGLAKKLGQSIEMDDLTFLEVDEASAQIKQMKTDLGMIDDPCQQMRGKIISMARSIGWEIPTGNQRAKADMEHIEDWCKKYGMYKKGLNAHNEAELTKLVTQFQQGPFAHRLKKN